MKIGFIGGGNMAEALIKGLLVGGVPATDILVGEPATSRQSELHSRYGVTVRGENLSVVKDSDLVILAIKPQIAAAVMKELAAAGAGAKLYISIMAGVTIAAMEAILPAGSRVVRVMPNTPALVLEGGAALSPGSGVATEELTLARRILELVGRCWVVEEKLLDAVTGLSGSGPAYVLTFIEALADAGVKNGLPRDIAAGLALQTVYGTAKLLRETGEHPAILREKVTSPGGTTIAGLHVLEADGFRGTIINAVDAATARSKELGK
jgi:pyrroline-5-carboxylate reductase